MRGINRVTLLGNLGKDPETQYLDGNIPVSKFSVATTEAYKDKNGKLINQTEWHIVVFWRGLAELAAKYLHKGSLVYIEGKLRTRNWEDKEGKNKFATEIVGDKLIILDKKADNQPIEGFSGDEGMGNDVAMNGFQPAPPNHNSYNNDSNTTSSNNNNNANEAGIH